MKFSSWQCIGITRVLLGPMSFQLAQHIQLANKMVPQGVGELQSAFQETRCTTSCLIQILTGG